MFRVGQRVICVDDVADGRYSPFSPSGNNLEGLRKGDVYTIRFVGMSLGVSVVRVREIERRYSSVVDGENVYAAARFRPAVDRPTSIEFAHEILRKATRTDEVSV